MQNITRVSEYDDLKKSNRLVVVQFSAEWCGPCKVVKPKIERLANKYPDLVFLYFDVDNEKLAECPDAKYVRGVPTFKFFKDNELVESFAGANEKKVEETIKKYI